MTQANEKNEQRAEYEPPSVQVLGTLAELTLGHPRSKSDGIGPGSIINR